MPPKKGQRRLVVDQNTREQAVRDDSLEIKTSLLSSGQLSARNTLRCRHLLAGSSSERHFLIPSDDLPSNTSGFENIGPSTSVSKPLENTTICRSPICHDIGLFNSDGVSSFYKDLGDCNNVCNNCDANFWYEERVAWTSRVNDLRYQGCCSQGRVWVPKEPDPPEIMKELMTNTHFLENIRAYNQMFSMTSFGAKVDDSINTGRSPYVFRISGQIYHWIGSMCPSEGEPPRFLQMYVYDTEHEVENRLSHFGGIADERLSADVVTTLITVLDEHNHLVKLFRTARDKLADVDVPLFRVKLFSVVGNRQYDLSTGETVGTIIFDSGPKTVGDYDVIVEQTGGIPQNKEQETHVTYNEHVLCQLHERQSLYSLLLHSGRLFQQYIVGAYCCIELNRIDYIRNNQQDIRNEYLSGLHDAIDRGDYSGSDVGSRVILPSSFTGGPRYIYSHYLDALAICRVIGNPQFFITFTCNPKWPEIRRFLDFYPYLTPADRADIVSRLFHMRVK
ncbi:uncharacterized protein [Rutidosis leptorrhynchoides]|uniref:uncharacterized protein n=1 Tax=Rutidosis leptorrhynchoides TaxID=125765 RepID=UPI003A98FE12